MSAAGTCAPAAGCAYDPERRLCLSINPLGCDCLCHALQDPTEMIGGGRVDLRGVA